VIAIAGAGCGDDTDGPVRLAVDPTSLTLAKGRTGTATAGLADFQVTARPDAAPLTVAVAVPVRPFAKVSDVGSTARRTGPSVSSPHPAPAMAITREAMTANLEPPRRFLSEKTRARLAMARCSLESFFASTAIRPRRMKK
jgi:hypothetical protein